MYRRGVTGGGSTPPPQPPPPPPPPPSHSAMHSTSGESRGGGGGALKSVSTGTSASTGVGGGRSGLRTMRLPCGSKATGASWSAIAVATSTFELPAQTRRGAGPGAARGCGRSDPSPTSSLPETQAPRGSPFYSTGPPPCGGNRAQQEAQRPPGRRPFRGGGPKIPRAHPPP